MLAFVFSKRMFVICVAGGVFLTACVLLTGMVVTPLATVTTFAASFAALFGVLTAAVNVAISRMDYADNIDDSEEIGRLMALQRQLRWERVQPLEQPVAHFLEREIAAGNPMWDFTKSQLPTNQKSNNQEIMPDDDCYRVGGHNLRKRK
jgi:hypothetical protein